MEETDPIVAYLTGCRKPVLVLCGIALDTDDFSGTSVVAATIIRLGPPVDDEDGLLTLTVSDLFSSFITPRRGPAVVNVEDVMAGLLRWAPFVLSSMTDGD